MAFKWIYVNKQTTLNFYLYRLAKMVASFGVWVMVETRNRVLLNRSGQHSVTATAESDQA